jgi:hypothetical protein
MIGLVNAIGVAETARSASTARSLRGNEAEAAEYQSPVLNKEQAVYRVLRSAVDALENPNMPMPEQKLPDGMESDRYAQDSLEEKSAQPLGGTLDVTA